jgi:hypothetical protein
MSEVRSEVFILCGVVTVTFRVLSLFTVTKCYGCSKTESVIINCSSDWWISNNSTHRAKPTSKDNNTRDNIHSFRMYIHWVVSPFHPHSPSSVCGSVYVEVHIDNSKFLLWQFFLASFTELGLWDLHPICVPVYPPSQCWMPEPVFMRLGMYITETEPTSKAYFINSSINLCVCMCFLPTVAGQRLG